jgi:sugar/nucleoside kinase (ribokinase family)
MTELLVIGAASLDRLHFMGQQADTAGGAGLYTASAAHRAGASVTLFAPRPANIPKLLKPLDSRVQWIGPRIEPDQLPRLEIIHHGAGRAELLAASWGASSAFDPGELPGDLTSYAYVHIAAMPSAQRQLAFFEACAARGANRISVGTYAHVVHGERDTVRSLFDGADVFFMNENEATGLFGSVEKVAPVGEHLVFVTLGARGALVLHGKQRAWIPSPQVEELDPTGAGDSFCGATLAGLANGLSAEGAATAGVDLAAEMITGVGPAVLWREE